MPGQIHQATQQTCRVCNQPGIWPREQSYTDHHTQEIVVEASWVCNRCGNLFDNGELSRTKINEQKEN